MPPVVIAAGIAAAGSIGGAVLSSSAQKKAASQAADTSLQTAQMNNDLAREFRQENQANFQPFLSSGTQANSLIDSFLYGPDPSSYYPLPQGAPGSQSGAPQVNPGLGGTQSAPVYSQTPVSSQNALFPGIPAPSPAANGDGSAMGIRDLGLPTIGPRALGAQTAAGAGGANLGGMRGGGFVQSNPQPQGVPTPVATGGQTGSNPFSGYQAFVNSPYYQFPYQQGLDALNNGYAANGMIESGAAMKGITKFGQDYGYGKMLDYLGLAGDQANRGVQSAGAIAGVGVNALNNMTANNNNAGNVAANAALARGAANAGAYSQIGGALGNLAGAAFGGGGMGSSYSPNSIIYTGGSAVRNAGLNWGG